MRDTSNDHAYYEMRMKLLLKSTKGRNNLGDLMVDGRIILKWNLKKNFPYFSKINSDTFIFSQIIQVVAVLKTLETKIHICIFLLSYDRYVSRLSHNF